MATESSSSTYEERWVRQGLRSIETIIEIEATPTIFQVTKELKETLGEAYTPQRLGLGAYHHLSPHLHVADRQKHALIRELIIDHNRHFSNFSLNNLIEEMKDLEAVIRSNYDNYLDLEPPTLAYIMAIDSLYLLAFLQCYHHNSVDLIHKTLAKDVLKLENQIPAATLTLAGNQLGLLFLDNNYFSSRRRSIFSGDTKLYADFFYAFCTAHSPLKLAQRRDENLKTKHLLAHLYYLIVNNKGPKHYDGDKAAMPPEFMHPDSVIVVTEDSNFSPVAAVDNTPTMTKAIETGSFDDGAEPYRIGFKDEDDDDDDITEMPKYPPVKNPDSVIEDSSAALYSNCPGEPIPTMTTTIENGTFDDGAEPVIKPYRSQQLNQGLKDEDEDDDDKAAMIQLNQGLKDEDEDDEDKAAMIQQLGVLANRAFDKLLLFVFVFMFGSFDGAEPYRRRQPNQGLKDEDEDEDSSASLDSNCLGVAPTTTTTIENSSFDGAEPVIEPYRRRQPIPVEVCCKSLELEETVIKPFRTVTTILQVWKSSSFANYIFKQEEEEKAKIEEIQIPSASELSKKFNVDFKLTHGGIRGIKFQATEEGGGEANTLFLPEIKLESDSEVVLRNLVAYEAALFAADSGSKLELTDYVDLMCGIVDTTEDVKLLREKDIIVEGDLSDEKIAEMFNGINRSTAVGEQSESQKAVEEVKKMVEEWEKKIMWKRAYKFCNKIMKSTKELLVKKPAIIAMKYLTYIFLSALLILQILQAYCGIYDCSRRESQTTNVATRLMSVI